MTAQRRYPPGWDRFLDRATRLFNGETPGAQTRVKLASRFGHGSLTLGLLDILDHMRSIDARYDPADWWGEDFRPPFTIRTGDPVEAFIPSNMRQLARDPARVVAHLRAYVAFHMDSCREDLAHLDRDLVADAEAAAPCLAWAESRPDPVYAMLVETDQRPEFRSLPVWPRYLRAMSLMESHGYPGLEAPIDGLRRRASVELLHCTDRFDGAMRAALGLEAIPEDEVRRRDAEIERLRSAIGWCEAALGHLDEIIGAGDPPAADDMGARR